MALARSRLIGCAAAIALSVAGAAHADPAASAAPGAEAATRVVETLHAAMLETMRQGPQLGYEGRLARLEPEILASYDFSFIAEKSIGLAWKKLDAAQRAQLIDLIGQLAAATYAARMADFSGEKFETLGTEPASQDTIIVQTRIVDEKGTPIPLDYRLRNTDAGPRIVDVFYDGTVSELAMRRSEYSSLLKKGGVEALVDALEKKIGEQATARPPA